MSDKLDRANARARAASGRMEALQQGFVRTTLIGLAASALGEMQRRGVRQVVGGVPVKLGIGATLKLAEAMSKGDARRWLGALSDSTLACYFFNATLNHEFVSGIQEVGRDSGGGL